jgi:hypothetical protein
VQEELEDGGPSNRRANASVAQEVDRNFATAESKQSGKKREVFLADMGRQSKGERGSVGDKSAAPLDVEYAEVARGVLGNDARRDRDVLDWNKQQVCMCM